MLAVHAFTYTGPLAQGQAIARNLPCVAVENTAMPGPGGIIEIFYPDTGAACFHRDVWEHYLKLREGGAWAPK